MHLWLQKAFVTERADLIDNNRKKWQNSMQQRRDKEVISQQFLIALHSSNFTFNPNVS